MLRFLFLLLILLAACPAGAQQNNYIQYTIANGLPSNTIYDVKQDLDGFIWIATDAGLVRFDGRTFVTFTTQDGLPSNDVLSMFPDSKGRLWISSMHNSISYHYNGKIYSTKNDSMLSKMKFSGVPMLIRENEKSEMMIGATEISGQGMYLVKGNDVIPANHPEKIKMHAGISSGPGPSEFALSYFDTSGKELRYYVYNKKWEHQLTLKYFRDSGFFMNDKNKNTVLFSGKEKIIAFPQSRLKFDLRTVRAYLIQTPPIPDRISSFTRDGWRVESYGTANGTYLVDTSSGLITDHLLPGKVTNRSYTDKENNLWICTNSEGLIMYPSRNVISHPLNKKEAHIHSLYKAGNIVYAGSSHGNLFRIRNNNVSHINFDKYIAIANNKTADNRLLWIEPLTKSELALCFDDFMLKYDPVSGQQQFARLDVNKKMFYINADSFLAATGRGTFLLDKNLSIIDTLLPIRSSSAVKVGNVYYAGTASGPVRIIPGKSPVNLSESLPDLNYLIDHMQTDADGGIWMSTMGNGIFKLKNDRIEHWFNTTNGLNSNNCKAMFIDAKFIWVGTEKGLNRINRHNFTEPVQQYSTEDGLASNDIHSILSDSGIIYLGSEGFLTWFDSTRIKPPSICLIRMLGIEAGKRSVNADSLTHLKHTENNLKFNFTALSFRSSNNILYQYRLKGLSDTWDSTRNHNLEFLALPPGEYQLEIFARNKFGQNSNTISIPIVIYPPFWATWWFRLLVIGIVVACAWWIILRRIRSEKEKANTQNRINELEQQALRSQMNPHFIFNCLNSIQNFLLQNNFEKTNEYLTAFAHLIRQTLDNSSRTTISIEAEMKYLSSYLELECMRFAYSFNYSIEVDPDIDTEYTHIPTMILQPYVENSIRHGIRYRQEGEKTVNVNFMKRGNTLVCIVQDSGVGRKKASELKSFMHLEYQSKGMRLTAERIEALNRRQEIPITVDVIDLEEAGNASGTQVIVRFPNMFL